MRLGALQIGIHFLMSYFWHTCDSNIVININVAILYEVIIHLFRDRGICSLALPFAFYFILHLSLKLVGACYVSEDFILHHIGAFLLQTDTRKCRT
jgi:hypothetical protein